MFGAFCIQRYEPSFLVLNRFNRPAKQGVLTGSKMIEDPVIKNEVVHRKPTLQKDCKKKVNVHQKHFPLEEVQLVITVSNHLVK